MRLTGSEEHDIALQQRYACVMEKISSNTPIIINIQFCKRATKTCMSNRKPVIVQRFAVVVITVKITFNCKQPVWRLYSKILRILRYKDGRCRIMSTKKQLFTGWSPW